MFEAFYQVFAALSENEMVQHIFGIVFVLGAVLLVLKLVNRGGISD